MITVNQSQSHDSGEDFAQTFPPGKLKNSS